MSFLERLFAKKEEPAGHGPMKVKLQAHPLVIGEIREARLFSRLGNLLTWFEQRGDTATPEKIAEMEQELKKSQYALAARGYPIIETMEQLNACRNI